MRTNPYHTKLIGMKKFLILLLLLPILAYSQAPNRFDNEVMETQKKNDSLWDASKPTLVFTGSSSIRMWKDLQDRFPEQQVLNTGFGGSQFSDLELYLNELILNYKPTKVFIYEGDNDVNAKVRLRTILDISKRILNELRQKAQHMEIVLISPKPSISRWKLRRKYRRLNRKLSRLTEKINGVDFVDVWHPMLNKRKVKQDIFIEDGLHMNTKGYDIWYEVLKNHVK